MKFKHATYEKGQSKACTLNAMPKEIRERNQGFKPANTPDLSLFTDEEEVGALSTYQSTLLWAGYLIKHGRDLDSQIDYLLSEVAVAESSFYSSKRLLKDVLDTLLNSRESMRNFELDVEEFMNIAGVIDHAQTLNVVSVVSQLLNQINATYSRVFDLCILKLNSISNSRVTYTNILISATALLIAMLTFLLQK